MISSEIHSIKGLIIFLQVITLQAIMPCKDSGLDTRDYIVAVVTTITTPSNDFPYSHASQDTVSRDHYQPHPLLLMMR